MGLLVDSYKEGQMNALVDLELLQYVIRVQLTAYEGDGEFYYNGNSTRKQSDFGKEQPESILTDNLTDAKVYKTAGEAMRATKQLTEFYKVRPLPVSKMEFFKANLKGK